MPGHNNRARVTAHRLPGSPVDGGATMTALTEVKPKLCCCKSWPDLLSSDSANSFPLLPAAEHLPGTEAPQIFRAWWEKRGEGAARLSLRRRQRALAGCGSPAARASERGRSRRVPASFDTGALRDGPITAGHLSPAVLQAAPPRDTAPSLPASHGSALVTTARRPRRGGYPFSACPSTLPLSPAVAPHAVCRARELPPGRRRWPLSALPSPAARGSRSGGASRPPRPPARGPQAAHSEEVSALRFALPGWRRGPAGSAPPPQAGQETVAWRACSGCCWPLSTLAAPSPFSTSVSDKLHPPSSCTDTLAGRASHFVCSADSPSPLLHPIIINLCEKEPHPHPFRTQGSTPWEKLRDSLLANFALKPSPREGGWSGYRLCAPPSG